MARFTLSIELVNANENDYKVLHTELKKHSFKESHNKKVVQPYLRPEYIREGNVRIQDVVFSVSKASAKTGKQYSYTIIRDKSVRN